MGADPGGIRNAVLSLALSSFLLGHVPTSDYGGPRLLVIETFSQSSEANWASLPAVNSFVS